MSADERYVPEQLPATPRPDKPPIPGLWAIRDTKTDELVTNGDEIEAFAMRRGVLEWIRRNKYVSEVGSGRP